LVGANTTKTALVVSAHSADFVWRAGGAIALYASRGWQVTVVCLSFGERGESAKLWREPGMTLEKVKSVRKEEAEKFWQRGRFSWMRAITQCGSAKTR
jgi:4-oxalomesaconate hydratase